MPVVTFNDFKKKEDEKDKNNADQYFAGGISSHGQGSGQAIIGGNKEKPILIKKYKNGFFVDNGPFRSLESDENKRFYDSVNKGFIPTELEHLAKTGQLAIDVEDHSNEDYEIKTNWKGAVHTLSSEPSSSPSKSIVKKNIVANDNEEKYSIRVRMTNGIQKTFTLNSSNTVEDLYSVVAFHSDNTNFTLMTPLPPKPIEMSSMTLKEAKLNRISLIQK